MPVISDDTIYALSSGVGRAAIAVIRLSGPHVRAVLTGMCGSVPAPRQAWLARLRRRGGTVLDEALVLFFAGPRSETGEDICEFQVHGGRAVVVSVLTEIGSYEGLRTAEPGEFARRALLNGKMGLVEVEALADLIDSETELQRAQAIEGGGSLLRGRADAWRSILLDVRAELEAGHDFSDEGDVSDRLDSRAERILFTLVEEFREVLARAWRGERVRDGFRVVLMGPPNAGKSSLLNAIAGRDVAIVSATPGTTRDRLDVHLDLGGIPVVLTDTAGLQESSDAVEIEGIRRSLESGRNADLVLWLSAVEAPSAPPPDVTGECRIIRTKVDLGTVQAGEIGVSVVLGTGIPDVLDAIESVARVSFGTEPALLTRRRHEEAVGDALIAVQRALEAASRTEICAEELRLAEAALDRLVGRIDVEEVLGAIFSRFCVGK